MSRKWVISDIHGCLKSLKALIAQLPVNEEIIIAGDLIDRGPDSPGVVKFVMENNFKCVLGNHEDLFLDHLNGYTKYYPELWPRNGGNIEQLLEYTEEMRNWIRNLPLYLVFDDCIDEKNRKLFVSHAGVKNNNIELATKLANNIVLIDYSIIWYRGAPQPSDEYYFVFGHTPDKDPYVCDWYAAIDTGCAYKKRFEYLNKLTAFSYPDKQVIFQENIDME